MELYQLEQFISLIKTENMHESAEELSLTQPAISKNIKKLEDELGCRLFDRDHSKLKLNKYGKILAKYSYSIFDDINAAKKEIRDELDKDSAFISCCGTSIPVLYFLMPCIANLAKEKIFVCMRKDISSCRENFMSGKYDFILSNEAYEGGDYENIRIFEEKLMLTLPGGRNISSKKLPVSSLSDFGKFYLPESAGYIEWFESILDAAKVTKENRNYLPLDKYLEAKHSFDSCNLYSSFFDYFIPEINGKAVYELEGEGTSRGIYLNYKKKNEKKIGAIISALEGNSTALFNHVSFASFFMFHNEQTNLIFK